MTRKNRAVSFAVLFAMVLLLIPPFGVSIKAATYTFSQGAVVLDSTYDGADVYIENGVYSVTVCDGITVNIIFEGVQIDHSNQQNAKSITLANETGYYSLASSLYNAGKTLGWTYGTNYYYVPTCPFLITEGSTVTARFDGDCVFKAGGNGWYMTSANDSSIINASKNSNGYAGIQVDSGSTLIISGGTVAAYGGYQSAQDYKLNASNSKMPNGITGWAYGGGAGIGGGAAYNTATLNSTTYVAGTPGTIIINNGDILAVGGYQGAGIGGGANGAATDSKIEINGGAVKAYGGNYAAAIGEGDSISPQNGIKISQKFSSEYSTYEVIINSGTVEAYGGYEAAAIGTTDQVSNSNGWGSDAASGLSVTIYGGDIYAVSGLGSTASSAIGAGNNTNMEDNSITIYSAAKIVSASFSKYAISNYGTDGSLIPSVNIDPEGYIYLARFKSSTSSRTFKLYPVKRNANGHIIYVSATTTELASGLDSSKTYTYYAYDPEFVDENGEIIGGFYLIDANGVPITDTKGMDEDSYYHIEDIGRIYPRTMPELSAYFDVNGTVLEEITVPGSYKAVAITLPNPEDYGGAYVLDVPPTTTGGDDTYVLLEKDHPGVTSGEISSDNISDNISDTHISVESGQTSVPNPPDEDNRTPNITVDTTALPLIDLNVGIYNDTEKDPTNLVGDPFVETVYGYTFYVPSGTENYWLNFKYLSYDSSSKKSSKITTFTVNGTSQLTVLSGSTVTTDDGNGYTTCSYDTSGNLNLRETDRIDIWIKKTDTEQTGGASKTVSYKITIIVKDVYDIEIDPLDKVYDGNKVTPNMSALVAGRGYETDVAMSSSATTIYTDISPSSFSGSSSVKLYYYYTINYIVSRSSFSNGTATYTITFSYNNNTAAYTFDVDSSGNITHGNNISLSLGYYNCTISGSGNKINLSYSNDDTATLDVSAVVNSSVTSSGDISETVKGLKESAKENGSASSTITSYEESGELTYNVTIGSVNDNFTASYTSSGDTTVTVTYNAGTDKTSIMSEADKSNIVYTYYKDADGDGELDETELASATQEAPKDAGKYIVEATLDADKYEAKGELNFEISKRKIQIVAVQNWLTYVVAKDGNIYLTAQDTTPYNGVISAPGTIYFENVVSGDAVDLKKDADGKYISEFYYADTTIAYGEQKIIIKNPVLNDDSDKNYYLTYTGNESGVNYSKVPGQIAYKTDASIFRKTETNTSLWRKFYPSTLDKFIDFYGDYDGVDSAAPTPDYHSPYPYGTEDNRTNLGVHREYVKLRTVGDTSARYSVDIEFGAMNFEYTKEVWNVNTGKYDPVEGESKWNGNDSSNNEITVTNRSNEDIAFEVSFTIDFIYAARNPEADSGIKAAIYNEANVLVAGETYNDSVLPGSSGTTATQTLAAATAGKAGNVGTAQSAKYYLVLSGNPSSITQVETSGGQGYSYTNVGSVTVTLRDPTETS